MTAFDTAWDLLKVDAPEYQGHHQAPIEPDYHSPLHDLTGMYPEDLYSHMGVQYYGDGSEESRDRDYFVHNIIMNVRNKPDAEVMVYRAIPASADVWTINPGDWVTLSRSYAHEHGLGIGNGKRFDPDGYRVVKRRVKAKDVFSEGNSLQEYGWRGHT